MALDQLQNFVWAQYLLNLFVDFDQILYMIDIDKMWIWMSEQYFLFIFNRVMALDWCWNFVYAQYLVDQLMESDKIL